MSETTATPVMMLAPKYATHARHSGYGRLSEYVRGAIRVEAPRKDPTGGVPLFLARMARRFAFTRWYLGGSASMEWQAWQAVRKGFRGVVHNLWADHDLGYLDLALRTTKLPFVGTFHNCPDDFPVTLRFPQRVQRFAAVVLMSECQRAFLRQAGVADEKLHVVLHGVDTEYFRPQPHAPKEHFTVLSAGGFRRNFPLLREVCAALLGEPGIRFQIVAPRDFAELFAGLPNVEFASGLSDEALLERYQTADCLLHTAEQATANNVLLEAMACGAPVVAERIGGIPEYVNDACARLTAPLETAALVEAVRSLASAPAERAAMGAAARRRAEELAWPKVAARMEALYRELAVRISPSHPSSTAKI